MVFAVSCHNSLGSICWDHYSWFKRWFCSGTNGNVFRRDLVRLDDWIRFIANADFSLILNLINIYRYLYSEPSYRSTLVASMNIWNSFGYFMTSFLNTLMAWRTVCAVCLAVPFITAFSLFFVSFK